jgi:hypothetical protein
MRKKTIADLSREYEKLYYSDAVYNATGNAGYEMRRLISTIRSRLRSIEEWARPPLCDMRLARQKRESTIAELRAWDVMPKSYRDGEWIDRMEKTNRDKWLEIIRERGKLFRINRVAKEAANAIEASNKTRYY